MHGEGTMTYPDDAIFVGLFVYGQKSGQGKITYPNGVVYEGEWGIIEGTHGLAEELINGYKKIYLEQGIFKCEWGMIKGSHDKAEEYSTKQCKMIYNNGDVYEGDLINYKKNGHGTMEYKNSDVYEGEWKDDVVNGQGKMIYANGGLDSR